jgi:Subtilase family
VSEKDGSSRTRMARWLAATALALAGTVIAIIGVPAVCEDQLAQTGDQGVVRVCHGVSITDVRIIGLLAILLLLVWPDLSELTVGIVKLTRRVEEQTSETKRVGEEVRLVGVELRQTISQQVSQSQSISIYTAEAGRPHDVSQTPPPPPGVEPGDAFELLLSRLRQQRAYLVTRIADAEEVLQPAPVREPRVAIVGAGFDSRLRIAARIPDRIEPTYDAGGRAYEDVRVRTGTASIGHILAIAPSARILPVSVLGPDSSLELKEGITAAFGWRPDVLLIGLESQESLRDVDELLARISQNACIIAPSGNDGGPSSTWPGRLPQVIAAGAVNLDRKRASFSNTGDIWAPGVDVECLLGVSDGGFAFGELNGTTVSADIVAGICGLLLSRTSIPSVELRGILSRSAHEPVAGAYGVVDAVAAAQLALELNG